MWPAVLSQFIDGSHVVVVDTGIAGCIHRKSGGHCVIARGNDASWQRSQQLSFAIEGEKREGENSG
ncbi:hypothetical protein ALC56_10608 [Trachymyrmex septentrionalis]|uniref:Uncharacterized protein n=1 Tax=Trachymyrmex septentrionalis TaxID=34720 RepID=A0A195F3P8_9HYME|nr:hypothetical protein ALC56_10608 [Trachymyrmex septentrionalis]